MIKVYSALDRDVFLAIMDEAEKQGIKVVGHVPDTVYLEDAVTAGQSSIEHWFGFQKVIANLLGEPVDLNHGWMSSGADYLIRIGEVDPQALHDFYQRLEKSGVTIVPTVVTFRNLPNVDKLELQNLPHGEYISTDLFSMWKTQWAGQTEMPDAMWQSWAQMVRQMNEAGIPLMVGTDLMCPGLVPGYSVHEEMMIWQEAGIPPADILRSATIVPDAIHGIGGSPRQHPRGKNRFHGPRPWLTRWKMSATPNRSKASFCADSTLAVKIWINCSMKQRNWLNSQFLPRVQSPGENMDHVVYLDAQAKELENLLSGSKTMIIRGATGRKLPHGRVDAGDMLYFINNNAEGKVRAKAKVKSAFHSEKMTEDESHALVKKNQPKLSLTEKQIKRWAGKRYIVLIEVADVKEIPPFAIDKSKYGNMDDWLPVEKIESVTIK